MPTVGELTALYANFMLAPRRGRGVCRVCFNFTRDYELCYACTGHPQMLDVVAPISYSVAHEQLHHVLGYYKQLTGDIARRLRVELAAVLWRHLLDHERCVADAVGTPNFELVTIVPSGERRRDRNHPLRAIVGQLVEPARDRYERLLERSPREVQPRVFDPAKYTALRPLGGEHVLLIDDTWTTGANAQSAAAALKDAGAAAVGAVVIGRHLNREWHENDCRLRGIQRPFNWGRCALCGDRAHGDAP